MCGYCFAKLAYNIMNRKQQFQFFSIEDVREYLMCPWEI